MCRSAYGIVRFEYLDLYSLVREHGGSRESSKSRANDHNLSRGRYLLLLGVW